MNRVFVIVPIQKKARWNRYCGFDSNVYAEEWKANWFKYHL